jgi:hypothetical protein
MQKLAEKSQRALANRHNADSGSNVQTGYAMFPQPQPTLPPSFSGAHPLIAQAAERMEARSQIRREPPVSAGSTSTAAATGRPGGAVDHAQESWLPDIYHFSSLGLSLEERYAVASAQPTPFIASSPRVAENQTFNFDHGALSVGLVEETSYMAWF